MTRLTATLIFAIAGLAIGCGGATQSSQAILDAAELTGDLASLADDLSSQLGADAVAFTIAKTLEASGTQTIDNGSGGKAVIKWTHIDEDNGTITRNREITFSNFVPKNKHGNVTKIVDGTLTYTFTRITADQADASLTRTLKGTITIERTKADGTTETLKVTLDLTFTRDPTTGCVTITGTVTRDNGTTTLTNNKDMSRCQNGV